MCGIKVLLEYQNVRFANSFREAYNAAIHGWNYDAFHRCVDGFGAGVVLARAEDGSVFGGFNPRGWISLGENRDSNAAFLFTWPDGDTNQPAIKLPKVRTITRF